MEEQFWQDRWTEGRIGFHEPAPNALLQKHFSSLNLTPGAHVFVPLCGKTTDIDWLLSQGHTVSGIEFNRPAIDEVFTRLSLTPEVTSQSSLTRLSAGKLTLWHGDFFALKPSDLDPIDAIYDRAALVALPDAMRANYAVRLPELTDTAPQLLISFDYDQSQMTGPPFSVPEDAIRALYHRHYTLDRLDSRPVTGPLATRTDIQEQTWKLTAKGP